VIDDGSADGTAAVARSFPEARYVFQPHGGVSIARNRGILEARGDIIAFLDSDDMFAPSKLEKQLRFLEEHPEYDICYCEIANFSDIAQDELSERQQKVMAADVDNILPSACIRRSVFEQCGFFDVTLSAGEDTEWIYRVQRMKPGCFFTLPEILYHRRIHNENLSFESHAPLASRMKSVLAKSIMHSSMLKNGKKVSVVIPAYNAEKYLNEAIQSVYRQNWIRELELIIVDNHSTDRTLEIAQKYHSIVLQESRKGAAFARNKGIEAATGDFIVLLDADDYFFTDNAAEELFRPLRGAQPLDAVFGKTVDFISPELPEEEKAKLQPRTVPYSGILPGCSLIRKSVFEKVGLFDTAFSSGETIEWMMRLKAHKIASVQIDSIILSRRLHLTNTGRLAALEERKNYAALLRKRMAKNG